MAKEDVIKKYPELDEIAKEMSNDIFAKINAKTWQIKSEMPYKAQYVLEEIIKRLENGV